MSDKWISVETEKPVFGQHVYCYCDIYGRYIGRYEQILDTKWGNWVDPIDHIPGGLPPRCWMPITYPEPPKEDTNGH